MSFFKTLFGKARSIQRRYRRVDVSTASLVKTVKDYQRKGYSIAEKRFNGVVLTKGNDIVEVVPQFAMSYLDKDFDSL
jgi:hypothetical protein